MKARFRVYENDWSLRQGKDPMSWDLEKWLNSLAESYKNVEVVAFQHGQNADKISGTTSEIDEENYSDFKIDPYETVYCIAKVWIK